ncbi:MAG: hypothetical protein IPO27_13025 [Bacteroidetes bacterium]|nr:hypothetical protein [Bacteroidota bacterium]
MKSNRMSIALWLCMISCATLFVTGCSEYYDESLQSSSLDKKGLTTKSSKNFEYLEKEADYRFKTKNSIETKRYIDKVTNRFGGVIKATQINPQELNANTIELPNDSIKVFREEKLYISQSIAIPSPYFDSFLDSLVTRITRPELLEIRTTDRSYEVLKNKLYAQAPVLAGKDSNLIKQERKINAYELNKLVEYSTINITYYEDSHIRTEVLPNISKMMKAETAFGVKASDAFLKSIVGVERFLLFIIRNWIVLLVLGSIGFVIYKIRKRIFSSTVRTLQSTINQ